MQLFDEQGDKQDRFQTKPADKAAGSPRDFHVSWLVKKVKTKIHMRYVLCIIYVYIYIHFVYVMYIMYCDLSSFPSSQIWPQRFARLPRAYTVKTIEFSPDGTKLAVAQSDNIVSDGLSSGDVGYFAQGDS